MKGLGKRKGAQLVAFLAIIRRRRLEGDTLGLLPSLLSPAKEPPDKLQVFH